MSKDWLKATVRYEMAKLPGFKSHKKTERPVELIPTLKRFLESDEWWKEAKKLLAAASKFIVLGDSESAVLGRISVCLDHKGLLKYTRNRFERIDVKVANELLAKIHKNNPIFDPVLFIRQELDRIADNAP